MGPGFSCILISLLALGPAAEAEPADAAALEMNVADSVIGQASTPASPESPEAAHVPEKPTPPPPPAGDRWLLMKTLQGTWAGWELDARRMHIEGWTDLGFTASSATHTNMPMGQNYLPNQFMLQQNWLHVGRSVITTGTTEPTFGFRTDFILPGTDYRYTLARGIFNEQLTADNGRPIRTGIDPIYFHLEGYFPTVARGMDVKFGRFAAPFGNENNDAVLNIFDSHIYGFIYNPYTQTGLLTTTQLTEAWLAQAGVVLGNDIFIDPADQPTFVGSLKWAPATAPNNVRFAIVTGPGRFDAQRHYGNPSVFDVIYNHNVNARLSYTLETLYSFMRDVPKLGTVHWVSIPQYLSYTLTPRLSANARIELFDDAQGQRTGFRGWYSDYTINLVFKPCQSLIFRPEIRYDYNGDSRPFEGKHDLFTAAMDVIVRW